MCRGTYVEATGKVAGIWLCLPLYMSSEVKLGCQAWEQVARPTEQILPDPGSTSYAFPRLPMAGQPPSI